MTQKIAIHPTAIVNAGVSLAEHTQVGPYVILGEPPHGKHPGEVPLSFGEHATIRSHTVIYAGNVIGAHFNTGHHVLIRERNEIGDYVSIGSGTVVEHHVKIGHRVRLHSQVFVPEFSVLEDDCWLGPNVVITNAKYPRSPDVKEMLKGAHIGPHAKIGANATLLPGVKIGAHALVGAGAVVTEDVPNEAVVVGNQARVIKSIRELPYEQAEQLVRDGGK